MQQTCRFTAGHMSTSTLKGDLKYCLRTLRLEKADDATCIPQSSYTQRCICVWSVKVNRNQGNPQSLQALSWICVELAWKVEPHYMLDPVAVIRNMIHGGTRAHVHIMHQLSVLETLFVTVRARLAECLNTSYLSPWPAVALW